MALRWAVVVVSAHQRTCTRAVRFGNWMRGPRVALRERPTVSAFICGWARAMDGTKRTGVRRGRADLLDRDRLQRQIEGDKP
jgi:hypothetical protein